MTASLLNDILLAAEHALAAKKGYDGWMIGRCRLSIPTGLSEVPAFSVSVIKERKSIAVLRASAADDIYLEMTMLLPTKGIPAGDHPQSTSPGIEVSDEISFSLSVFEMEQFLNAVGDDNPLHRGESAILPGFLVLNRLLSALTADTNEAPVISAECRFLSPLCPGETVVFRRETAADISAEALSSGKLLACSDGREILAVSVSAPPAASP